MIPKRKRLELDLSWLKAWFDFKPQERMLLAGILIVALIGLTARYVRLAGQTAEPYQPEGVRIQEPGVPCE